MFLKENNLILLNDKATDKRLFPIMQIEATNCYGEILTFKSYNA